jgi:hypothetical protein
MFSETLIRFVTQQRHPPHGNRAGIFREAYRLWHDDTLPAETRADLRTLLDWFNTHLERPQRLAASPAPYAGRTAIPWLRESASHHVAQLRRLADLIGEAGVVVEEINTTRPGYIVYRDAYQVMAQPFTDAPQ